MKRAPSVVLLAGCFALLQVLDFVLTWSLLNHPSGSAREANPVAAAVLNRLGWAGLGLFKLGCAAVPLAGGLLLGRRQPRAARRLLLGGCCCVLTVVVYSAGLQAQVARAADDPELAGLRREQDRLVAVGGRLSVFFRRREEVCRALLAGRTTLDEATDEVTAALRGVGEVLASSAASSLPSPDDRAGVAASLLVRAARLVGDEPACSPDRLAQLKEEYAGLFPADAPRPAAGAAGPAVRAASPPPGRRAPVGQRLPRGHGRRLAGEDREGRLEAVLGVW